MKKISKKFKFSCKEISKHFLIHFKKVVPNGTVFLFLPSCLVPSTNRLHKWCWSLVARAPRWNRRESQFAYGFNIYVAICACSLAQSNWTHKLWSLHELWPGIHGGLLLRRFVHSHLELAVSAFRFLLLLSWAHHLLGASSSSSPWICHKHSVRARMRELASLGLKLFNSFSRSFGNGMEHLLGPNYYHTHKTTTLAMFQWPCRFGWITRYSCNANQNYWYTLIHSLTRDMRMHSILAKGRRGKKFHFFMLEKCCSFPTISFPWKRGESKYPFRVLNLRGEGEQNSSSLHGQQRKNPNDASLKLYVDSFSKVQVERLEYRLIEPRVWESEQHHHLGLGQIRLCIHDEMELIPFCRRSLCKKTNLTII